MNTHLLRRSSPLVTRKLHVRTAVYSAKPTALVDSIIRVDHAGELGADRIYAGQMAILGNSKMAPVIQHMWDQEKEHKAAFEKLILKHRVRPTAFIPVWNIAGFLLGAGSALLGEKAAMACTVAVEAVIVEHYNDQLRVLMEEPEKNKELMETIQKFRDDEQEHHDNGLHYGAEGAPFYHALTEVIKFGCKTAIAISKGLFFPRNQLNFTRGYCTSTKENVKKNWDLYSAVCLERKPVLLKPLSEIEKKVALMMYEIEVENSHKSDHEIHGEEDALRAEMYKKDTKKVDMDAALKQTAHEFEEVSNKEFQGFCPGSIETPDDEKNDFKSVNRELSNHLWFLVRETLGSETRWLMPQGVLEDSETLRQAAERILREKCGDKLKVSFLGNAPCGFYKYHYPKEMNKNSIGAKVFFFKALYISGEVEPSVQAKEGDFRWATRRDLNVLLDNEKYLKKISMFLIEEENE